MKKYIVFILLISLSASCKRKFYNNNIIDFKAGYASFRLPACFAHIDSNTDNNFLQINTERVIYFLTQIGEADSIKIWKKTAQTDSLYADTVGHILKQVILGHNKDTYWIDVEYIDIQGVKVVPFSTIANHIRPFKKDHLAFLSLFYAGNNPNSMCMSKSVGEVLFTAFKNSKIDTAKYYKYKSTYYPLTN